MDLLQVITAVGVGLTVLLLGTALILNLELLFRLRKLKGLLRDLNLHLRQTGGDEKLARKGVHGKWFQHLEELAFERYSECLPWARLLYYGLADPYRSFRTVLQGMRNWPNAKELPQTEAMSVIQQIEAANPTIGVGGMILTAPELELRIAALCSIPLLWLRNWT